jgi:hypothetical protein
VEAILNYSAPRNLKQLRQFLGICNFHSRFIISYANYTGPLLSLLKQGTKRELTTEKQQAFQRLKESFANTIQLVHLSNECPYAIYTDASKLGFSGMLMQKSD